MHRTRMQPTWIRRNANECVSMQQIRNASKWNAMKFCWMHWNARECNKMRWVINYTDLSNKLHLSRGGMVGNMCGCEVDVPWSSVWSVCHCRVPVCPRVFRVLEVTQTHVHVCVPAPPGVLPVLTGELDFAHAIRNAASARIYTPCLVWGRVKCVYSERAVTVP